MHSYHNHYYSLCPNFTARDCFYSWKCILNFFPLSPSPSRPHIYHVSLSVSPRDSCQLHAFLKSVFDPTLQLEFHPLVGLGKLPSDLALPFPVRAAPSLGSSLLVLGSFSWGV